MKTIRSYSSWFIVYLSQQTGIGWQTLSSVIVNGLHENDNWDNELLSPYISQHNRITVLLNAKQRFDVHMMEKLAEDEIRHQYRSILWNELDYPAILRECVQPPWVIFIKGLPSLLQSPKIGMVGTRAPSQYGIAISKKIAQELSEIGCTIVSGLAGGIDTIAHYNSLKHMGSTVAVLPCGIKNCYPSSNRKLYEQIEKEGLLLSESVHANSVHKGQFSQRNRLIAGLAFATIIVEGEKKSGSMITAKYTLDMDRELYAIPGSLYNRKSEGPNFLICKGYARMLMSVDQIFEDLPWLSSTVKDYLNITANQIGENKNKFDHSKKVILSYEENIVLQHIRQHPLSIEDLMGETGYSFESLNVILLQLCLYSYIQLHHGSLYIAL